MNFPANHVWLLEDIVMMIYPIINPQLNTIKHHGKSLWIDWVFPVFPLEGPALRLSMDNLVVFSLIMTTYRVPACLTRKAGVRVPNRDMIPSGNLT
jgi:hypothetical protein